MPTDPTPTPDDASRASTDDPENPAAPARKRIGAVAMAVAATAGVAMGVGAGAFVGAPMLARRGAEASAPAAKPAAGAARGEVLGGPMHLLDNMVLNPAESGASRFLLVSVALQLTDEGALTTLKTKDAALRDRVLRILGAHRVEELSDMRQRDALRARIRLAVDSLAGGEAVTAVYFPQFVIQ